MDKDSRDDVGIQVAIRNSIFEIPYSFTFPFVGCGVVSGRSFGNRGFEMLP
jgi:hypothetical protein